MGLLIILAVILIVGIILLVKGGAQEDYVAKKIRCVICDNSKHIKLF